ncbi:hypothetical protein ANO14919_068100 [Xylariales sp. No.14919]|nr:hypothetical protein ANO14919_068100 [Xylariales sp. No.14919]
MSYFAEPLEKDVENLLNLLEIPRAEAISRLKANGNNAEKAANEYFDNPASTKYRWDESAFNTGREGETNDTGISFNIQGADEVPSISHVNSAAPTRPPSRTNNRSPLGPTNTTQEDADLARAIAESAAASGITPQEIGVIDHETNSKHFGPANRPEYDTEMWAMVPTKATVEAEAADPPPSNRKRDADAPAFLRQTKNHRLGALLSIYSKIPLARNFLLRCGRPAPTYGHNTEWWKGDPILRPDVLAKMAKGDEVWGEDLHPDFIDELHRLVAFLDQSERSYANADSLSVTKAIDESFGSWPSDVEDRLFQALQDASADNPDCGIEDMVTTGKIMPVIASTPDQTDPSVQTDEEDETITSFIFLDIALDYDSYQRVDTMYDALDHLLWSSALSMSYTFPQDAKTAVLLKPAEVLTVRFGGVGFVKPCDIPAVFYADRYMNDRRELALHFQTQIREIKNALKNLAWSEEERVNCAGQLCCFNVSEFNYRHDVRECSMKLIKYAEKLLEGQKNDSQWRQFEDQWRKGTPYSIDDLRLIHTWSGPSTLTDNEEADRERWEHIIQVCKDKIEDADRVLAECQQKKQELNRYLDVVRKRLTCPEHEADDDLFVFRSHSKAYRPEYWDPSTKYLLRGVATTNEVAYVCVRDVEDSPNSGENPVVKDQWWKIGYVKSDASPIKSEKVTPDDVLQAAGTESKNPILVYASEMALNKERIPLSDALRMFVKADNRSFQQELAQEASLREIGTPTQNQDVQMQDQPQIGVTAAALSQIPSGSRGKRKHSIGSSVATNGSTRSDLADVELTFDDPQPVHNDVARFTREHSGSGSSKLGDVVESLAKCQTHEYEAAHNEKCEEKRIEVHSHRDADPGTNTTTTHKIPEMSERKGVVNPFLTRAGNSAQNSIDMMDLDTEHEIRGG